MAATKPTPVDNSLPDGWLRVRLRDLADVIGGKYTPGCRNPERRRHDQGRTPTKGPGRRRHVQPAGPDMLQGDVVQHANRGSQPPVSQQQDMLSLR